MPWSRRMGRTKQMIPPRIAALALRMDVSGPGHRAATIDQPVGEAQRGTRKIRAALISTMRSCGPQESRSARRLLIGPGTTSEHQDCQYIGDVRARIRQMIRSFAAFLNSRSGSSSRHRPISISSGPSRCPLIRGCPIPRNRLLALARAGGSARNSGKKLLASWPGVGWTLRRHRPVNLRREDHRQNTPMSRWLKDVAVDAARTRSATMSACKSEESQNEVRLEVQAPGNIGGDEVPIPAASRAELRRRTAWYSRRPTRRSGSCSHRPIRVSTVSSGRPSDEAGRKMAQCGFYRAGCKFFKFGSRAGEVIVRLQLRR